MPRSRDLLNRFRPTGTPGAAGAAGVPVDHEAGTDAELAPVFTALTATESACDEILSAARARADRIREEADEQGRRVLADALAGLGPERVAVVARLRAHRAEESAAEVGLAEQRATRIRATAEERLPACVEDLAAAVRHLLTEAP